MTATFQLASLDFECSYTVEHLTADEAGGPWVVYEIEWIDLLDCDGKRITRYRDGLDYRDNRIYSDGKEVLYYNLYRAAEKAAMAEKL